MKKPKSFQKKPEKLLGTEREGLLVAHFGARVEVEDAAGHVFPCHLPKNLESVITGDRVLWRLEQNNSGVIVDYVTRKSLLARPLHNGKNKLIAANIDAIIIVTSPLPNPAEYLIDRYTIAAEHLGIQPVILLNKIDLLTDENRENILSRLNTYKKIGYPVLFSSTYLENGLTALADFLQNKTCVLVGTSGVGKSSIISTFLPHHDIHTQEVSDKGSGKHTTTITRLYHLPHGGNLIDSPGVREFNLWHMDKKDIAKAFIEFKPFLNQCKFRNCSHTNEPDCAVQHAVAEHQISASRFESFRELMREK